MTSPQMIFVIGANHESASIDLRERLFLNEEAISATLPEFLSAKLCDEVMVLSTCNRLELVGVTQRSHDPDLLIHLFYQLQVKNHKSISMEVVKSGTYCFLDDLAIQHVFRVASGLDSLVLGETQITGQFKSAMALGQKLGTVGPVLTRLCQEALHTTGKIRTYTDLGRKTVSLSHAAVDLVNKVYGDFDDRDVLIIGAGEMSRLAAKYVAQKNPRKLMICNRTPDRADKIVEELGRGEVFSISEMESALQLSDIVISATSHESEIISASSLAQIQKARQYRPWFLVDIALPRDIPPAIKDIENVYLFEIDDLKQIVAGHLDERKQASLQAKGLVETSTTHFLRWLSHLTIKPALKDFRLYLDDLFGRELQKTCDKDLFANLLPEQRDHLQKMLRSIGDKLLADASAGVLRSAKGLKKDEMAQSLATLFPRQRHGVDSGDL